MVSETNEFCGRYCGSQGNERGFEEETNSVDNEAVVRMRLAIVCIFRK